MLIRSNNHTRGSEFAKRADERLRTFSVIPSASEGPHQRSSTLTRRTTREPQFAHDPWRQPTVSKCQRAHSGGGLPSRSLWRAVDAFLQARLRVATAWQPRKLSGLGPPGFEPGTKGL